MNTSKDTKLNTNKQSSDEFADLVKNNLKNSSSYNPIKVFWIISIIIILSVFITNYIKNRTRDGLYMIYACSESGDCYALKSDVEKNWNSTTFKRFYFNNGRSVELDCTIDSEYRDCYEVSEDVSPVNWEVKSIIEYLGNKPK